MTVVGATAIEDKLQDVSYYPYIYIPLLHSIALYCGSMLYSTTAVKWYILCTSGSYCNIYNVQM
jgi:hypothetical protein